METPVLIMKDMGDRDGYDMRHQEEESFFSRLVSLENSIIIAPRINYPHFAFFCVADHISSRNKLNIF